MVKDGSEDPLSHTGSFAYKTQGRLPGALRGKLANAGNPIAEEHAQEGRQATQQPFKTS